MCIDRMNRENDCGGKEFGEADHTRDNDGLCYAYIAFYFYCHFRVLDLSKIKHRRAAAVVLLNMNPIRVNYTRIGLMWATTWVKISHRNVII